MSDPKAVLLTLVPPEYKPSDPYPLSAPDDPEWIFEGYDDYYGWLSGPFSRALIYDALTGKAELKGFVRKGYTGLFDSLFLVEDGFLHAITEYAPSINNYQTKLLFTKYAASVAETTEPQELAILDGVILSKLSDGHQVVITRYGDDFGGALINARIIPNPTSGESVFAEQLVSNSGGPSGDTARFTHSALSGDTLTLFAQERYPDASFLNQITMSNQPSLLGWVRTDSNHILPDLYMDRLKPALTSWYFHHIGAASQPVPMDGGDYIAMYRPNDWSQISAEIIFARGQVGADGLPAFTETRLDVKALCIAALPDLSLRDPESLGSEIYAANTVFYGEPAKPTPAQFWTAMINATEIV